MIDESKFKRLKQQADSARSARDKAAGQLENVMSRLQEEFNCDSIEAADKMVAKLTKEASAAEKEYNKAVEEFEAKWADYVN